MAFPPPPKLTEIRIPKSNYPWMPFLESTEEKIRKMAMEIATARCRGIQTIEVSLGGGQRLGAFAVEAARTILALSGEMPDALDKHQAEAVGKILGHDPRPSDRSPPPEEES